MVFKLLRVGSVWLTGMWTNPISQAHDVEGPSKHQLELATKCMKEVQRLTSSIIPSSTNIYQLQCQYLAEKLTEAVTAARTCFQSSTPEYIVYCQDIYRYLCGVAEEIGRIVSYCYKDQWIQAALILGDQTENISLLVFELKLCTTLLPKSYLGLRVAEKAMIELGNRRKVDEFGIIKDKARIDRETLLLKLDSLKGTTPEEMHVANILIRRLKAGVLGLLGSLGDHADDAESAWKVEYKSLTRLKKLGQGSFGSVHETKWLGHNFAEKTFGANENLFKIFMNELTILAGLSHPNVVPLYCYAINPRSCSIVMELMDGDLYHLMQERMRMDETLDVPFDILEAVDILLQIAEGMYYLHENKVVHRDLKSENILIRLLKGKGDKAKPRVHAKVADFGLSRVKEMSRTTSDQTMNTGTTRWMAPELFGSSPDESCLSTIPPQLSLRYPFKSDVYSFGMVCYEILTGQVPFSDIGLSCLRNKVLQGVRPEVPRQCPDCLTNLMYKCWNSSPRARPDFAHICVELRHLKCLLLTDWKDVSSCQQGTFLSIEEIRTSTYGFGPTTRIGQGPHGRVFHAPLSSGVAAIKILNTQILSHAEFLTQVSNVSRLNHENVVGLTGHCFDEEKMVLAYEFAPMGSLSNILHGKQGVRCSNHGLVLDWMQCIKIAIDVAKGLQYLHEKAQTPICPQHLKSSNILLFEDNVAKIECFHYKDPPLIEGPPPKTNMWWRPDTHPPECLKGTVDPPTAYRSDVYCFGVILLDLITGLKNGGYGMLFDRRHQPVAWGGKPMLAEALKIQKCGHRKLASKYSPEGVAEMIAVAALCVQDEPDLRPDMSYVVKALLNIFNPTLEPPFENV